MALENTLNRLFTSQNELTGGKTVLVQANDIQGNTFTDKFYDAQFRLPAPLDPASEKGTVYQITLPAQLPKKGAIEPVKVVANPKPIGENVTLTGRVVATREQKTRAFVDIQCGPNTYTVLFEGDHQPLLHPGDKHLLPGHMVTINGTVAAKWGRRSFAMPLEIHADMSKPLDFYGEPGAQPSMFSTKGTFEDELNSAFSQAPAPIAMRHPSAQKVPVIGSAILNYFEQHFSGRGYLRFAASAFLAGNAEGGAKPFSLEGYNIQLAQSPQLEKEIMAMTHGRVYTACPAFRNDPSSTRVHLPEFTSLDVEMAIYNNAVRPLDVITGELEAFVAGLYEHIGHNYARTLKSIDIQLPQATQAFPRIPITDTKAIIEDEIKRAINDPQNAGRFAAEEIAQSRKNNAEDLFTETMTRVFTDEDDLSPAAERIMTDYAVRTTRFPAIFVTDYAAKIKPFYTQPKPSDSSRTESFDLILDGREISSGGQRVHDPQILQMQLERKGMLENGQVPQSLGHYYQALMAGAPAHGGFGVGYERLVNRILNNIPHVSQVRPLVPYPMDKYLKG